MKIDIAIHSSDSNPFYLDFWPIVSKLWKTKFNITPLLVYIDENHDIPIDTTYGMVLKMKPVSNVPLYLQCQWVRFWIPSLFPDKICITSDIDMLPVSKEYFVNQIRGISDDKYVHLNPNHQFIPACYHIAKGTVFQQVLELDKEWETSIRRLHDLNLGHDCVADDPSNPILPGKINWGAEEEYLTRILRGYKDTSKIVYIPRTHHRIDRGHWIYNAENMKLYADAHCVRPLSVPQNRKLVEKLVREIEQIY
jgi:hypothetical protein